MKEKKIKKPKKILKMSDTQADWAAISYVPVFNLLVILFNRKEKVLLYHAFRGLIWMINVLVPAVIVYIFRSYCSNIVTDGNWKFFAVIYFIIVSFNVLLIIDYIKYFIDCRRYVYQEHLIDKIYKKPLAFLVKLLYKEIPQN
jgi:hypothetical protein